MMTRAWNTVNLVSKRNFPAFNRKISTRLHSFINNETKQDFYKQVPSLNSQQEIKKDPWNQHYCVISKTQEDHVIMATHQKTTEVVDPKDSEKTIKVLNCVASTTDLHGFQGNSANNPTYQRIVFRKINKWSLFLYELTHDLIKIDPKTYILVSCAARLHERDVKLFNCYQERIWAIHKSALTPKERFFRIRRINLEMLRDNFNNLFIVYNQIKIEDALV